LEKYWIVNVFKHLRKNRNFVQFVLISERGLDLSDLSTHACHQSLVQKKSLVAGSDRSYHWAQIQRTSALANAEYAEQRQKKSSTSSSDRSQRSPISMFRIWSTYKHKNSACLDLCWIWRIIRAVVPLHL